MMATPPNKPTLSSPFVPTPFSSVDHGHAGTASCDKVCVCLYDWWLVKAEKESEGKWLAVSGFTTRKQAMRLFTSAPIAKRYDTYSLETADGIIVILQGMINKARMHDVGLPSKMSSLFLIGFPYDWEDHVQQNTTRIESSSSSGACAGEPLGDMGHNSETTANADSNVIDSRILFSALGSKFASGFIINRTKILDLAATVSEHSCHLKKMAVEPTEADIGTNRSSPSRDNRPEYLASICFVDCGGVVHASPPRMGNFCDEKMIHSCMLHHENVVSDSTAKETETSIKGRKHVNCDKQNADGDGLLGENSLNVPGSSMGTEQLAGDSPCGSSSVVQPKKRIILLGEGAVIHQGVKERESLVKDPKNVRRDKQQVDENDLRQSSLSVPGLSTEQVVLDSPYQSSHITRSKKRAILHREDVVTRSRAKEVKISFEFPKHIECGKQHTVEASLLGQSSLDIPGSSLEQVVLDAPHGSSCMIQSKKRKILHSEDVTRQCVILSPSSLDVPGSSMGIEQNVNDSSHGSSCMTWSKKSKILHAVTHFSAEEAETSNNDPKSVRYGKHQADEYGHLGQSSHDVLGSSMEQPVLDAPHGSSCITRSKMRKLLHREDVIACWKAKEEKMAFEVPKHVECDRQQAGEDSLPVQSSHAVPGALMGIEQTVHGSLHRFSCRSESKKSRLRHAITHFGAQGEETSKDDPRSVVCGKQQADEDDFGSSCEGQPKRKILLSKAFASMYDGVEDSSVHLQEKMCSTKKCKARHSEVSREEQNSKDVLSPASDPCALKRSEPSLCQTPVTRSKVKELSQISSRSLNLRQSRYGRIIVPPLIKGQQRIIYDEDGLIAGIAGTNAPKSPEQKHAGVASCTRKKRKVSRTPKDKKRRKT